MAERTPVQFIDGPEDNDGFNDPLGVLGNGSAGDEHRNGEHAGIPQSISGDPDNANGSGAKLEEYTVFSPLDIGAGITDRGNGNGSSTGRRRGRPPGSTNRPKAYNPDGTPQPVAPKKVSADLGDVVETLLYSVHLMGANLLSLPELEIEKDEAKQLSTAIREVQKFYPDSIVSPKKLAIGNLIAVASGIYITRAVAIYKRAPKKAKVLTMPSQPAPRPVTVDAPPTPKPSEMAPSDIWTEEMHTLVPEGN